MTATDAIEILYRLNTGVIGKGSERHERPHKPVMLLAVLDGIAMGKAHPDRVEWSQWLRVRFKAFFDLVKTLDDSCTPELPFFHLKTDGFWQPCVIEDGHESPLSGPPHVGDADTGRVFASFDQNWESLLAEPVIRMAFRDALVSRYFPKFRAQIMPIICEPGTDLVDKQPTAVEESDDVGLSGRSAAFRRKVIELYDHQCAACGLRIWLKEQELTFVDAAHLIPFSESRNDHPTNGLALCKNHHWALDQRLIAPDPDRIWHISRRLEPRRSQGEKDLAHLAGQRLLAPSDEAFQPRHEALAWRLSRLLQ
ncbi:MAG: HNH endonuclease [Cephaloticoccus sp.]|nr:HNH endonuclease [Cephaloticoccus sp.]